MLREELKIYLKYYPKVVRAIKEKRQEITIGRYGQKKTIVFAEWAKRLEGYVEEVLKGESSPTAQEIIRESVMKGRADWKVMLEVSISESSYYRMKRMITERIYELYISEGMVTREEILQESVSK